MNFVEQVMNTTELPLVALVNNAGVMTTSPLEHHDMRDARRVFDVNFFGVLSLLQLALPALRRSGGRVVNVSSMVAVAGDIDAAVLLLSCYAAVLLLSCSCPAVVAVLELVLSLI
jgi:NAD(P)-dependent dehydrogenase (short-subunit alcohol dehydrogenase family)